MLRESCSGQAREGRGAEAQGTALRSPGPGDCGSGQGQPWVLISLPGFLIWSCQQCTSGARLNRSGQGASDHGDQRNQIFGNLGSVNFCVDDQTVNILGFASHMVSCHCNTKSSCRQYTNK